MSGHKVISHEKLDIAIAAYNKELERWMLNKSERIVQILRRGKENATIATVKEIYKINPYSTNDTEADIRRQQVEYAERRYKTLKERAAFRKALQTLDNYY